MDEEFSKRMSAAKGKQRIIELASDADKILDLGAGNLFISKALADMGKYVVAVEKDPPFEKPGNAILYAGDMLEYCHRTEEMFDCIILSAVLHELRLHEIHELANCCSLHLKPGGKIIIREAFRSFLGPIHELDMEGKLMLSEAMKDDRCKEYFECSKIGRTINKYDIIDKVNAAFAVSYGKGSWEREKHEIRFCHRLEDVVPLFCPTSVLIEHEFDNDYYQWFEENGLNPNLLGYLMYTSMTVVLKID